MQALSLPPQSYELPDQVLRFAQGEQQAGRRVALTVVTGLSGGSMRRVGSLAAISETGAMAGYVSNGCIDADIAMQAVESLGVGRPMALRYGAGSPFVDLRLPCGGSVDLLVVPDPDPSVLRAALGALDSRRTVSLSFDETEGVRIAQASESQTYTYAPALRLLAAGRGPALLSVVQHARASDMAVGYASPDQAEHAGLEELGATRAFELISPRAPITLEADSWTAILLLFHDHDWEAPILRAAVATKAPYIGCLGSARTQAARRLTLEADGMAHTDIARIRGPIGLIPSARSAHDLAISVLAEIRQCTRPHADHAKAA
ncbi:MAG: XdhC family protein [Pseudomonadota bacterium]